MLAKVLLIFLLIVAVGILVFRLSDAGGEIARRKDFFINPFTVLFEYTNQSTTTASKSPFPFPAIPHLPEDVGSVDDVGSIDIDTSVSVRDVHEEMLSIERETDDLQVRIAEAQQFGNPSPYRGLVSISESYTGTAADEAELEHVSLRADSENTAPVLITGWTLQSLYSRVRLPIPGGSRTFVMGQVLDINPISLNPGERAIISSGASPVGVSFKENLCTGYLGQFQTFVPSLDENCPTAEKETMSEPATTRTADPACAAYARTIPSCRFPFGEPPEVSATCYAFIRNAITYNGCLERHRWRPSFAGDTWRVFLGATGELWSGDHEVIRLLDAEGRTVDVWSY
jgi:hypothetical protein